MDASSEVRKLNAKVRKSKLQLMYVPQESRELELLW
jgi:hypothetical protein